MSRRADDPGPELFRHVTPPHAVDGHSALSTLCRLLFDTQNHHLAAVLEPISVQTGALAVGEAATGGEAAPVGRRRHPRSGSSPRARTTLAQSSSVMSPRHTLLMHTLNLRSCAACCSTRRITLSPQFSSQSSSGPAPIAVSA